LAHLLDRLILILYSIAVVTALLNADVEAWYLWLVLLGFPWIFFNLVFEIFMNGQSPGKQVMKIKVARLDGTPPTIGDYLLRWIFGLLEFYVLSGAIAVVVIAMGGKGQRLGDIVAGTAVVKMVEQHEISARDIFVTTDDSHIPTFSQAGQLSSSDIELIQRALEVNREQGNIQPVMIITEKIKSMLAIQSDLPPVKFL
jgi:uncharacterized RDD family membrane protein YckC